MLDDNFIETNEINNVKRNCPICQLPLKFEDYKKNGYHLDFWKNNKIAIPCCRCFRVLDKFSKSKQLEIEYPTDIGTAWMILNNLFKLGFIEKEKRDNTYKSYLEFLKNIRERNRLKHFLV